MQTSIRYSIAVYLGLLLAGAVVRPQLSVGLTSAPLHPRPEPHVAADPAGPLETLAPQGSATFVVTPPPAAAAARRGDRAADPG